MLRVKVYGPQVQALTRGGPALHIGENREDVTYEPDGRLTIKTPPTPEVPGSPGVRPRRATCGSTTTYPRGAWTRVSVTDVVQPDDESTS